MVGWKIFNIIKGIYNELTSLVAKISSIQYTNSDTISLGNKVLHWAAEEGNIIRLEAI